MGARRLRDAEREGQQLRIGERVRQRQHAARAKRKGAAGEASPVEEAAPAGWTRVVLKREVIAGCVPWGIEFEEVGAAGGVRLCGCDRGSVAYGDAGLRRCVGLVVVTINRVQVLSLQDALDATDGCDTLLIDFHPPAPHRVDALDDEERTRRNEMRERSCFPESVDGFWNMKDSLKQSASFAE
eukprot:gene11789-12547_t